MMRYLNGAAFHPSRDTWPLLADARQTGTVTTGRAPCDAAGAYLRNGTTLPPDACTMRSTFHSVGV